MAFRKKVCEIKEVLTVSQQELLSSMYPEYDLVFKNLQVNDHSMAAASRRIETLVCLDKLGYDSFRGVPDGYDDLVADFGGNFMSHYFSNRSNVHSDCPVMDDRDRQRWVNRIESIYRNSVKENERCSPEEFHKSFKNRFAHLVCDKASQECRRRARYGLMIHSGYDFNVRDVFEAMISRGIIELYGSIIFDDQVMYLRKGKINSIESRYTITDDGYIKFSFKNDNSMVYKHRFVDYMSYFLLTQVDFPKLAKRGIIELLENRNSIQFYKLTVVDVDGENGCSRDILFRDIALRSLEGKTKVKFYTYDSDMLVRYGPKKAMQEVIMYAPTDIVDKAMAHAFSITEVKFRPVEVFNFIRSYEGRIFFGNDVCVRTKSQSSEKSFILANAIYVHAYIKKYNVGKTVQSLLGDISYIREAKLGGWITKFKKLFAVADTGACVFSADGKFSYGLINYILYKMLRNRAVSQDVEFIMTVPEFITVGGATVGSIDQEYNETFSQYVFGGDSKKYDDFIKELNSVYSGNKVLLKNLGTGGDNMICENYSVGFDEEQYSFVVRLSKFSCIDSRKVLAGLSSRVDFILGAGVGDYYDNFPGVYFSGRRDNGIARSYYGSIGSTRQLRSIVSKGLLIFSDADSDTLGLACKFLLEFNIFYKVPVYLYVNSIPVDNYRVLSNLIGRFKRVGNCPHLYVLKGRSSCRPDLSCGYFRCVDYYSYYSAVLGVNEVNGISLFDNMRSYLLPLEVLTLIGRFYQFSGRSLYVYNSITGIIPRFFFENYQVYSFLQVTSRESFVIHDVNLKETPHEKFLVENGRVECAGYSYVFINLVDGITDFDYKVFHNIFDGKLERMVVLTLRCFPYYPPDGYSGFSLGYEIDAKDYVLTFYYRNDLDVSVGDVVISVGYESENSVEMDDEGRSDTEIGDGEVLPVLTQDVDSSTESVAEDLQSGASSILIDESGCGGGIHVGTIEERSISSVGYVKKEVRGDGNCLFYAVLGCSDHDRALRLREQLRGFGSMVSDASFVYADLLEETAADGVFAGTASIIAMHYMLNLDFTVYDVDDFGLRREVLVKKSQYPSGHIFIERCRQHYSYYLRTCSGEACDMVLPVVLPDVGQVRSDFKKYMGIPCDRYSWLKRFLGLGVEEFSDYGKGGKVQFVSLLTTECASLKCTCLHGIREYVDGTGFSIAVLLRLRQIENSDIDGLLADRGLSWSLLSLPSVAVAECIILLITDLQSPAVGGDLSESVARYRQHRSECDNCERGVLGETSFDPFYRTYYSCCDKPGNVITRSSNLDSCNRVLKVDIDSQVSGGYKFLDNDRTVYLKISTESMRDEKILNGVETYIAEKFKVFGMSVVGLDVEDGYTDYFSRILAQYAVGVMVLEKDVGTHLPQSIMSSIGFLIGDGEREYRINSMLESKAYYQIQIVDTKESLRVLYERYMVIIKNNFSDFSEVFNNCPDFGLIDMDKGHYLVRPKTHIGPHLYAFDGVEMIDISGAVDDSKRDVPGIKVNWLKPGFFHGIMAINKNTILVNGLIIGDRLSRYSPLDLRGDLDVEFIEGPPGCGKTEFLISNHEFSLTDTRHIILTASREASGDLRRRVTNRFLTDKDMKKRRNKEIMSMRYRTIDSFLMHFKEGVYKVDTLWIDEGLMKHYGDIMWCAKLSGASKVKIIGDRSQIPFINRVAGIELKYHLVPSSGINLRVLNVSYRCPLDVVALLNSYGNYGDKVYGTSKVRRSITLEEISSLAAARNAIVKADRVLVFTQSEKAEVATLTGRVSTINEYQGSQAENVVCIRLNKKKNEVYDSMNHIIVAISRHTKCFTYFTVSRDRMYNILSTQISNATVDDCKYVHDKMRGGYIDESPENECIRKVPISGYELGLDIYNSDSAQGAFYNLRYVPPTTLDQMKFDSGIRNFVQRHAEYGVVPATYIKTGIDIPIVGRTDHGVEKGCGSVVPRVHVLQHFHDELIEGMSIIPTAYDGKIFEIDELHLPKADNIRFSTVFHTRMGKYDTLTPVVRTSCPEPVVSTFRQTVKGFFDRNGAVPELQGMVDDYRIAEDTLVSFIETYVGNLEVFRTYEENPVFINVPQLEMWLKGQSSAVYGVMQDETYWSVLDRKISAYDFILKRVPKPKLDSTAVAKYPSPQTIAHLSKDFNAVFCPMLKELRRRLLMVLADRFLMYSDVSPEEFEDLLTVRFPIGRVGTYSHVVEIDMSKYDKSQNRTALIFEMLLYRRLGMPDFWLHIWMRLHVYTTLIDHQNQFAADVVFQRKSGDAATFFGNTVYLMAMMSKVVDLTDSYGLFSGDDSLLFNRSADVCRGIPEKLACNYNMEAKVLTYKSLYFCSKFLIPGVNGRWYFIPDPVKLLVKLGRKDLKNFSHVEQYRVSYVDLVDLYTDPFVYPALSQSVRDRYRESRTEVTDFYYMFAMLQAYVRDADSFRQLYYVLPHHVIDEVSGAKLNDI
uniref:Polyprotein n=1 Tax=Varroa destructor virus 4 TaxID=2510846 RepID=A0A5Q0TS59_9VIRU|nr:polyprotein [Varroa destructor virus 4]